MNRIDLTKVPPLKALFAFVFLTLFVWYMASKSVADGEDARARLDAIRAAKIEACAVVHKTTTDACAMYMYGRTPD